MSHIIASVTLAIPAMILAETALRFLGIGLQAAGRSRWGVLLQEAQNIRARRAGALAARPRRGGDRRRARPQLPRRRPSRRRRPLCELTMSVVKPCRPMTSSSRAEDLVARLRAPRRAASTPSTDVELRRCRRGRTFCLVGESGSGKIVTARSILRIVDKPGRITSGRIILNRATAATRSTSTGARPRQPRDAR